MPGAAIPTSPCWTPSHRVDFEPQLIDAVMAETVARANITFGDETLESTQVRGVSADYEEFSGYAAERGRLPTPHGDRAGAAPVALLGWETADKLFKGRNPVGTTIQVNGVHFNGARRQREEGLDLRQSQDEFVMIPLGAFQRLFGSRRSLELTVKPIDPELVEAGDGRGARRACASSVTCGRATTDNFGIVHVRHADGPLEATSRRAPSRS